MRDEWKITKVENRTLLKHTSCTLTTMKGLSPAAYRSGGKEEGIWLCSTCFEIAPHEMCNVADLMCEPLKHKRLRHFWKELSDISLHWGTK